jgi:arylamine N-acetyltransferase
MASQQYNTKLAYNKEQLHLYLKKINFFKDGEPQDQEIPVSYDTLERVIKGHVCSIPYGNSSYIYYKRLQKPEGSYPCDIMDPYTTQGVSTDLQDIFNKLVIEERDGVCIENNPLCAHMLMTLGFNTYLTSSNGVNPIVWDQFGVIELQSNLHAVIIVELDEKEYFLNAGGIGGTSLKPILMEDGNVVQSNSLVEYRITRAPYPDTIVQLSNPKHFPWLLESRTKQLPNRPFHKRNDWCPIKYINKSPVFLKDIKVGNDNGKHLAISKLLRSFIIMFISTDDGFITLKNTALRIYSSKNGVETIILKTEKERREAYEKYFNAKVPEDHKENLPSDISNYIYYMTSNINYSKLKNWVYMPLYYIFNKLSI